MTRKPTYENLIKYAFRPFTLKMIDVAHNKTDISYSEMDRYLENECGFSRLDRNATGFLAGTLMITMWRGLKKDLPLLNVLLVRCNSRVAGPGAGPYIAKRVGEKKFSENNARKKYWEEWRRLCEEGKNEVYAYKEWSKIYEQLDKEGLLDEPHLKGAWFW